MLLIIPFVCLPTIVFGHKLLVSAFFLLFERTSYVCLCVCLYRWIHTCKHTNMHTHIFVNLNLFPSNSQLIVCSVSSLQYLLFWRVNWMLWTCFALTGLTRRDTYKFGWPSKHYQNPSNYCHPLWGSTLKQSGCAVLCFSLNGIRGESTESSEQVRTPDMVQIPGSAWSFPVSEPLFPVSEPFVCNWNNKYFWQSSIWGACVRNKCQAKYKCYLKPQIRLEYVVTEGYFEISFVPIKSFSLNS